jgi:hypothetical protein
MTTDRDTTTRIVRSWLQTDEHESADRVLDAVLDRLDTTPQRRATSWPAWRVSQMNNTAKLAMGAAAVIAVALLGIGFLLPGGPSIGGPEPSATPEPTPISLVPSVGEVPLEPATYVTHPLASDPSLAVTITVPEGWQAFSDAGLLPLGDSTSQGPDGMALGFFEVAGLYSDPCNSLGQPDVDTGTTADDLAAAFIAQSAYQVRVSDATFAGYSGKQVELQLPSDFDDLCPRQTYFVFDGSPYAQGVDNRWHLTILDVEGSRLVIFTQDFAGTPAEDRAELESMVETIQIDPGD